MDTDRYAKLWGLGIFGRLFSSHLPLRLEVKALSLEPADEELCRKWFIGFLSENFFLSGLPAELDITFSGDRLAPRGHAPDLAERAILMAGGGKDTVVAGEMLKSLGVPFSFFTTGLPSPPCREIAKLSGNIPRISGEWFTEI